MRPRLLLRRILPRPPHKSAPLRTFTHNTFVRTNGARPQLPFLSIPTTTRHAQRVRYLTTERKQWIRYELKLSVKYTLYVWVALACVAAGAFAVQQEVLERQYPTPHEWHYLTRTRLKSAFAERDRKDKLADWVVIMELVQGVVERLEDPKIDGSGVRDGAHDAPPGTKDVSAMPEPWRRGYFEAMMLYATAAAHLDGWVVDRTRLTVFPPDVVIGPSNPHPKPIPPGAKCAPREEDCDVAYASPNDIYLRMISAPGLTDHQRTDASLAYANWLEFKGLAGPAAVMYERALDLALSSRPPNSPNPVDDKTLALKDSAGHPTANILKSLTAIATFRARTGDLSSALPIFISVLKARRSLPAATDRDASLQALSNRSGAGILDLIMSLLSPPPYPLPPDVGGLPPRRDEKELCEEAALQLHIGEIMYATRASSREEGLAWTKEGVDIAEEQLHRLDAAATPQHAKTTCRECLSTGLSNWATMVAGMATEAAAKEATAQPTSSWLGLWRGGKLDDLDRWMAEGKVVEERKRRAVPLLEDLEPQARGPSSMLIA